MSRKKNTSSGVYNYLELSGILDAGNEADIAQKRKEYWNTRKRLSNQEKRKAKTEFKIYLSDKELQVISKAAKTHSVSRTRYIRQAAIAYSTLQYLVPDRSAVNEIKQFLELNHALLRELAENAPQSIQDTLLRQMALLEQQILAALCNPEISTFKTSVL